MSVDIFVFLPALVISCLWTGAVAAGFEGRSESPLPKSPPISSPLENFPGVFSLNTKRLNSASQLDQVLGKEALVVEEYGFVEFWRNKFEYRSIPFEADVYSLRDAKAAYGLFTFHRSPESHTSVVGEGSYARAGSLSFWQANFYVQIRALRGNVQNHITELGRGISQRLRIQSELPALVRHLPSPGLKPETVRYFLGPKAFTLLFPDLSPRWFGFEDNAELTVAVYQDAKDRGHLILLGYPSHALSRHYFGKVLPKFVREIRMRGLSVWSKRAGVISALLVGNFTDNRAKNILQGVIYADSIQWLYRKDDPEKLRAAAEKEALTLMGTVVGSVLLTALFCLICIAVGVTIGTLRYLLRKFYPNNYWDRPEHVEMIRLKLVDR